MGGLIAWFKVSVADLADGLFGNLRMTKQRGLHVNLRTDDGTELGTVANPINTVGGGGGGGGPVTQATTPWVDNITQFGSSNVVTGTGVSGAGIPRVTVSSDSFPVTQPVSGTVAVSNFPATQPVSGTVAVSNLPATQPVSGTVTANQGGAPWSDDVTDRVGRLLGHVNVDNFPATQPVSGTIAATQSGAWNIGTVTTLTGITNPLPSGTNVIGHVIADAGSTIVVTGNVTVVQPTGANLHVVVDTVPTIAITIADGASVQDGITTDPFVLGDTSGTASAKLRGINFQLSQMELDIKLTNQLLFILVDLLNKNNIAVKAAPSPVFQIAN